MNNKILKGILITVLVILLILPIIYFVNQDVKKKDYQKLVETIENAATKYVRGYGEGSLQLKIKLSDLKNKNFVSLNLINPKTKSHLSNETYVLASYANGAYTYDVHLYDIPKKEDRLDLIMNLIGDKNYQNGISVRYEEPGINVSEGQKVLSYSTQYFYKDEEIYSINSSRPKNYTVVYTALNSKGEIAKVTRTVIVQ